VELTVLPLSTNVTLPEKLAFDDVEISNPVGAVATILLVRFVPETEKPVVAEAVP
jgi:hypothetical protein